MNSICCRQGLRRRLGTMRRTVAAEIDSTTRSRTSWRAPSAQSHCDRTTSGDDRRTVVPRLAGQTVAHGDGGPRPSKTPYRTSSRFTAPSQLVGPVRPATGYTALPKSRSPDTTSKGIGMPGDSASTCRRDSPVLAGLQELLPMRSQRRNDLKLIW
jgi:hypothetical protein